MRALRITEKSTAMLADAGADEVAVLDAFADGVNQYIETHRNRLDPGLSEGICMEK